MGASLIFFAVGSGTRDFHQPNEPFGRAAPGFRAIVLANDVGPLDFQHRVTLVAGFERTFGRAQHRVQRCTSKSRSMRRAGNEKLEQERGDGRKAGGAGKISAIDR